MDDKMNRNAIRTDGLSIESFLLFFPVHLGVENRYLTQFQCCNVVGPTISLRCRSPLQSVCRKIVTVKYLSLLSATPNYTACTSVVIERRDYKCKRNSVGIEFRSDLISFSGKSVSVLAGTNE